MRTREYIEGGRRGGAGEEGVRETVRRKGRREGNVEVGWRERGMREGGREERARE